MLARIFIALFAVTFIPVATGAQAVWENPPYRCVDGNRVTVKDASGKDLTFLQLHTALYDCEHHPQGKKLILGEYRMPPKLGAPLPTLGSAIVTLQMPTKNTDGTLLKASDILGYRIYYGTVPTSLTDFVDIPANTLTYEFKTLELGKTWYFAASTRTINPADDSAKSGVASKAL